ncbi:MAG: hypothetical protein IKC36_05435 [Clostridia bacterium]|nr:hypothetical protein [Clostridia bacterium]
MKSFLKKKYKRLIALIVFLAMGCVGLFLGYAHFTADASGAALAYETEGKMENLSAVSSTYDDSGYFLTTSVNSEGGERKFFVKKIGLEGQVEFQTELVRATGDSGEFTYVTGVTEDRVIAFTSNHYYLYALKENGLELLDTHQGNWNIAANPDSGVKNFAFDVHDGVIDIYSLHNSAGSATSIVVYAEKTTVIGDAFVSSVNREIKRVSGNKNKKLVSMGALVKGFAVTEDHQNIIAVFTTGKAMMFDTNLDGLAEVDPNEYEKKVKTITVGDGVTVTAAQYDGNNALYVFLNRDVYRITAEDFANSENEGYKPDYVVSLAEPGYFTTYNAQNNTLFAVSEDGNTVSAVDVENRKIDYTVKLKFGIRGMHASIGADAFICHWIDTRTERYEMTVYSFSELSQLDGATVGKVISLVFGYIGAALTLLLIVMLVSEKASEAVWSKVKWVGVSLWRSKWIYLVILPSFALLIMFSIYPSVSAIINSFFDYELGKPKEFIGWGNYEELFVTNKDLLLQICRNTVLLVGSYLFTQVVPPVFYAYLIMLLRNKSSVKIIRWFMYIPGLIPTIAAMLMWRYGIYGIDPNGAINIIIEKIFGPGTAIGFLVDERYAIWSILFIGFPWVGGFLLFYGALMTVPTEVYDACELEGCGLIRRFFVIDLPFIMGQVKYVSIGAIIAGVKSVGRIMATTEGLRGTMTLMYKLYDYLQADRLGMASTIAVIMVVLLAGISLARVRKMLKKENSYD